MEKETEKELGTNQLELNWDYAKRKRQPSEKQKAANLAPLLREKLKTWQDFMDIYQVHQQPQLRDKKVNQ